MRLGEKEEIYMLPPVSFAPRYGVRETCGVHQICFPTFKLNPYVNHGAVRLRAGYSPLAAFFDWDPYSIRLRDGEESGPLAGLEAEISVGTVPDADRKHRLLKS